VAHRTGRDGARTASGDGGRHGRCENGVGLPGVRRCGQHRATKQRRWVGQRVASGGVGPTGLGSPEAALGVEEGAGNFGSLPVSKSKIIRLRFKRRRL
jgi:hypothetical protein